MYSYVSAGELVAFVIGWNMVLEYLIGTAACACALSACLDTLSNGAVTKATGSVLGNEFGTLFLLIFLNIHFWDTSFNLIDIYNDSGSQP